MRIEFRVDWGYQVLYSRRHYHPVYAWDGRIECRGGRIRSVHRLDYPVTWWGPCQSARATELPSAQWRSSTRRGMAGIRVCAEYDDSRAAFDLHTAQGTFPFTVADLLESGRLVFPVGTKYSLCSVVVTREGFYWFRPALRPGEAEVQAGGFSGGHRVDWARMDQVWIDPGSEAGFEVELAEPDGEGEGSWLFRLQAMTAGAYAGERPAGWNGWTHGMEPVTFADAGTGRGRGETQARDYMPVELWCGDRRIAAVRPYLRDHDAGVQKLQDVWVPVPLQTLAPGRQRLRIRNAHPGLPLLVHRLTVRPRIRRHVAVSLPDWARVGQPLRLGVEVVGAATDLRLELDSERWEVLGPAVHRNVKPGRCSFLVAPRVPCRDLPLSVEDLRTGRRVEAVLPAAYAVAAEDPEILVGFDMTTVAHDDTGEMDFILEYTHRKQLGNLVVFRSFTPPTDGKNYARWGRFCREHGIHAMAVNGYRDGQLIRAAGPFMAGLGAHELSFQTYAVDPDDRSETMTEAAGRYMAFIRSDVESHRGFGVPVSYGDAGGGHAYSLRAGADFLRAETMVGHTMLHCSQARGAATAVGRGRWGVHIALQHAWQPYLASHLDLFFLSLAQPWMMGAQFLYEEDSLFLLMKEERQTWDDALTRGKRRMLRDFHRFAATHPRAGRPEIPLALLSGRGAAPFNGFVCGPEQDPSYAVWGRFGRSDPTWGHGPPEKAYQVYDVLMPGASTHPLRQRYDRRRFFFSGTPFGDFDQVPIEAPVKRLADYRLLLMLGWNTMDETAYETLQATVRAGATLLLGVPQLSTHDTRAFLARMHDLALFRDGDVPDLCGVRIRKRGPRYSGFWHATGTEFAGAVCPPLSRAPSVCADEDGPCYLADIECCGAEPVLADGRSGRPLLTRHRVGRGTVYLFTAWAYPGHEELADPAGAVVADLARRHMGPWRVEDGGNEVFWSRRAAADGSGSLCLLDTDWTGGASGRRVRVHAPWGGAFDWNLRPGQINMAATFPGGVLIQEDSAPHVEPLQVDGDTAEVRVHAVGPCRFRWQGPDAGRFRAVALDGAELRAGREGDAWTVDVDAGARTCLRMRLAW